MNTPNNNDDASSDNNSSNDQWHTIVLRRQRSEDVGASAAPPPATAITTTSHPVRRPSHPDDDDASSAAATATVVNRSRSSHHPRITPCSLNPASLSKRRICIASCGCFSSASLPLTSYIRSLSYLAWFLYTSSVFTSTVWLSVAGEATAIIFATCFHLTNETIFELLETTLIAVLVSFHMINSRNEHWDREEDLERDMIGLQFYIEHHPNSDDGSTNAEEVEVGARIARRYSSLSISGHVNPRNNETNICLENDVEAGAPVPHSDMTNISSFTTNRSKANGATANSEERSTHWWHHFFSHFLDGSAGVMYTSFLGLIIDEIVNYESSSK